MPHLKRKNSFINYPFWSSMLVLGSVITGLCGKKGQLGFAKTQSWCRRSHGDSGSLWHVRDAQLNMEGQGNGKATLAVEVMGCDTPLRMLARHNQDYSIFIRSLFNFIYLTFTWEHLRYTSNWRRNKKHIRSTNGNWKFHFMPH